MDDFLLFIFVLFSIVAVCAFLFDKFASQIEMIGEYFRDDSDGI